MLIHEAAKKLGVSERMLRHYEARGLMETRRNDKGYRRYSDADVRKAGRIRDLIGAGFSTREVKAMAPCLDDAGAMPCAEGIGQMLLKIEHIDRLMDDLKAKRLALQGRMEWFEKELAERAP